MNDELSTRAEAASAYLDGELDVAGRASVAADPDTMSLVDSFSRCRDALSDVQPVSDEVRSSAISAALAHFDATRQAVAVPARVPTPISTGLRSLRTRRVRAYRVLTRVAVAAVVVVVGVAALKASSHEDAKTSSATEPPAALPQSNLPLSKNADASTAGTAGAGVPATEGAAMVPAINNVQDLARYAASFARDIAAPAATTAAAGTSAPYVASGAAPAGTQLVPPPATPPAGCLTPSDVVLGPISVLGAPAFAVRDSSTGVVRAIAAPDCRVLFSTR